MNPNKIINGTFGTIWVNNEKWIETKSFEAKVTGQYEDVDIAGKLGKSRKYIGYEGSGSINTNKVYSRGAKLLAEAFKTGNMPEIKIISKLSDPSSYGAERVIIKDVTFDEFTLAKFELKSPLEEELPFQFGDYELIDTI
ncbi:phage tail tube protein [Helicovermis profundi]|uniref:Phage tail tube protein n=1 Tax=Helicovermis profundi TaxID=3065157 RepID=A0AAU9E4B5_9FIRM|nr:phage tail tube protein [Clostridia bacterium S502]